MIPSWQLFLPLLLLISCIFQEECCLSCCLYTTAVLRYKNETDFWTFHKSAHPHSTPKGWRSTRTPSRVQTKFTNWPSVPHQMLFPGDDPSVPGLSREPNLTCHLPKEDRPIKYPLSRGHRFLTLLLTFPHLLSCVRLQFHGHLFQVELVVSKRRRF